MKKSISPQKVLKYIDDYAESLRKYANENASDGNFRDADIQYQIAQWLDSDLRVGIQHDLFE